jgi:hypothetical protein
LWRGGLVKVLEVGMAMTKEERKEYNRAYSEANSEKLKESRRAYREANPEKEKERKRAYREANPEKEKERKRALREANLEKVKESRRAWREANPEKVKESQRAYYEANYEKVKERARAWYKANPKKAKETRLAYYEASSEKVKRLCCAWSLNQYKTNSIFAMKWRIRNLICKSLIKKGYTKKSRTHEILGCDYETFAAHLEAQFVDGMNWDNRDKWHIDHIIPLASAQTEEDVLRLNHYSNLQPLWAEDNLLKRDKMPSVQIQQRVKRNHAKLSGVHATLKQQSVFDLVAA